VRQALVGLLVVLAATKALGQDSDAAPERAEAPPARPEAVDAEAPATQPEAADSGEGGGGEEDAETPDDAPSLIPPAADVEAPSLGPEADLSRPAETAEELAACLRALDALGVRYERSEPLQDPDVPACGMESPVTVGEIAPGVALDPPGPTRCATALAAARWVADVVAPLARKLDRGELEAVEQGTAYVCRPRADGEVSEHAFGNALDVMGFRFSEGEPIAVEPRAGDGTIEEAFQRAVRAGACLDFTTVLGPGSDAEHADHLHLDVKVREGDFRICE
jgi:hypothetical protein